MIMLVITTTIMKNLIMVKMNIIMINKNSFGDSNVIIIIATHNGKERRVSLVKAQIS